MDLKNKKPIINLSSDDFGTVLNCAIRYSLGRQTYMPHLVMDFIRPLLPYLSERTLWCIERDIKEAEIYGGYGHPVIDEPQWKEFLTEVQREVKGREIVKAHYYNTKLIDTEENDNEEDTNII